MSADEQRVEIVSARTEEWNARFARLHASLTGVFPTAFIDHIGSTAVPDLPAKDVVDVLIGVGADAVAAAAHTLEGAGYDVEGRRDDHVWASWPNRRHREAVVHVMERGSRRWLERVAFRDALRADSELRAHYLELKQNAASSARGWGDYTARKASFVTRCLTNIAP